jgi:myo-inositol-1(or 4)-monophosphatase
MNPETIEGRKELVALALDAARESAKRVFAGFRKHPVIEHKGAIDLVTSYDRESERYLRERLGAAVPFAIVGEEEGGSVASGERGATWYVDPLDGTTNFCHGHPFFCVSIGLFVGAEPVLGAVVAPALHLEWTGAVGVGATRNGEPCAVSLVRSFGDALLATGFPYDRQTSRENNFDAFVSIKKQVQAVRRCGSAAIDLCFVGDGTYDGYWERKLRPWDLAAGAAIVRAAGGCVTAFDGDEGGLLAGNLVATNAKFHDALVGALARVTPATERESAQ